MKSTIALIVLVGLVACSQAVLRGSENNESATPVAPPPKEEAAKVEAPKTEEKTEEPKKEAAKEEPKKVETTKEEPVEPVVQQETAPTKVVSANAAQRQAIAKQQKVAKQGKGTLDDDADGEAGDEVLSAQPPPAAAPEGQESNERPDDKDENLEKPETEGDGPLLEKYNGQKPKGSPPLTPEERLAKECPMGWTYTEGLCGPTKWAELTSVWKSCADNGRQSPIHIARKASVKSVVEELKPIEEREVEKTEADNEAKEKGEADAVAPMHASEDDSGDGDASVSDNSVEKEQAPKDDLKAVKDLDEAEVAGEEDKKAVEEDKKAVEEDNNDEASDEDDVLLQINEDEAEPNLKPLNFQYNAFSGALENNGHAIVLKPSLNLKAKSKHAAEDAAEKGEAGYLEVYGKKFFLKQFHFHSPSEHTFDSLIPEDEAKVKTAAEELERAESLKSDEQDRLRKEKEDKEAADDEAAKKRALKEAEDVKNGKAPIDPVQKEDVDLVKAPVAKKEDEAKPVATAQAKPEAKKEEAAPKAEAKKEEAAPKAEAKKEAAPKAEPKATDDDDVLLQLQSDEESAVDREAAKEIAEAEGPSGDTNRTAPEGRKEIQDDEADVAQEEQAEEGKKAEAEKEKAEAETPEEKKKAELHEAEDEKAAKDAEETPEATKKHRPTPEGHYDIEMHLTHEASDGQVLIVAVFFKKAVARNSEFLARFWGHLPAHNEGPTAAEDLNVEIDPAQALPEHLSYFTYEGSLSAPPCKSKWPGPEPNGVLYFLMEDPLFVSNDQLVAFHSVYNGNNRPVQDLGGRTVFHYDANDALAQYEEELTKGPVVKEREEVLKPKDKNVPPQGQIPADKAEAAAAEKLAAKKAMEAKDKEAEDHAPIPDTISPQMYLQPANMHEH